MGDENLGPNPDELINMGVNPEELTSGNTEKQQTIVGKFDKDTFESECKGSNRHS